MKIKTIFLVVCILLLSLSLPRKLGAASQDATHSPPVTAGEYCDFLNQVASTDILSLYEERIDGIVRTGTPGSYCYKAIDEKLNSAINFVSQKNAVQYYDWLKVDYRLEEQHKQDFEIAASTSTLNFSCYEAVGRIVACAKEEDVALWEKCAEGMILLAALMRETPVEARAEQAVTEVHDTSLFHVIPLPKLSDEYHDAFAQVKATELGEAYFNAHVKLEEAERASTRATQAHQVAEQTLKAAEDNRLHLESERSNALKISFLKKMTSSAKAQAAQNAATLIASQAATSAEESAVALKRAQEAKLTAQQAEADLKKAQNIFKVAKEKALIAQAWARLPLQERKTKIKDPWKAAKEAAKKKIFEQANQHWKSYEEQWNQHTENLHVLNKLKQLALQCHATLSSDAAFAEKWCGALGKLVEQVSALDYFDETQLTVLQSVIDNTSSGFTARADSEIQDVNELMQRLEQCFVDDVEKRLKIFSTLAEEKEEIARNALSQGSQDIEFYLQSLSTEALGDIPFIIKSFPSLDIEASAAIQAAQEQVKIDKAALDRRYECLQKEEEEKRANRVDAGEKRNEILLSLESMREEIWKAIREHDQTKADYSELLKQYDAADNEHYKLKKTEIALETALRESRRAEAFAAVEKNALQKIMDEATAILKEKISQKELPKIIPATEAGRLQARLDARENVERLFYVLRMAEKEHVDHKTSETQTHVDQARKSYNKAREEWLVLAVPAYQKEHIDSPFDETARKKMLEADKAAISQNYRMAKTTRLQARKVADDLDAVYTVAVHGNVNHDNTEELERLDHKVRIAEEKWNKMAQERLGKLKDRHSGDEQQGDEYATTVDDLKQSDRAANSWNRFVMEVESRAANAEFSITSIQKNFSALEENDNEYFPPGRSYPEYLTPDGDAAAAEAGEENVKNKVTIFKGSAKVAAEAVMPLKEVAQQSAKDDIQVMPLQVSLQEPWDVLLKALQAESNLWKQLENDGTWKAYLKNWEDCAAAAKRAAKTKNIPLVSHRDPIWEERNQCFKQARDARVKIHQIIEKALAARASVKAAFEALKQARNTALGQNSIDHMQ